ncbi:hypothetical protein LUZ63_009589 [Rhynchospora breviuscula]|uniref:Beta-fructofuranosidase n=1 Tax=Rhynchospora breviuscula TaxID=2022672 RepID=A0A9Q0HNQ5_9POAL|nr:hypothetical protein LUZ63_009589 [Rhynchospora breviuscula]
MDPRDTRSSYVPLPTTADEAATASAASSRRRLNLLVGATSSLLLLLSLLGAALYISPHNGADHEPSLLKSNEQVQPTILEPAVSRGPSDGVSEKVSAVRSPAGSFPWSNSMLQWQRTGFHFQPEKNWMNDPNGPVYYKGWYHLFYQYNPDAAVWGNIAWGHAVSHDMVHWYHLPLAMVPDQWYDINGVWTGSATVGPDGQVYMLYTGSTNASVQVQNLAIPSDLSDPLLLHWTKYEGNPVLTPPSNLLPKDFRDPTTAWFDNSDSTWRIAIGSKDDSHAGIALVYKTKDFISYEQIPGLLHKVAKTGMWECVDFYAVSASSSSANQAIDTTVLATMSNGQDDVRHVLKASMDDDRHDYYAVGRYNAINNKWKPDNDEIDVGIGLRYDWGIFYASKTFFDPVKQRRILWGWIGETDSEKADIRKGWASLMSLPRTVLFDVKTKSNLLQWPVEEVDQLRLNSTTFTNLTIDTASYFRLSASRAAQLDIVAEFEIKNTTLEKAVEADEEYSCSTGGGAAGSGLFGPFGFLVLADKSLTEQTAVYFYISRSSNGSLKTHFCHDETRSSKATDIVKKVVGNVVPVLSGETLTMRILVDHSIVESFAQGGRSCITSRVYPTKAIDDAAGVYLFNNATAGPITAKSITIWEMGSSNNRSFNGNDGEP